MTTLASLLPDAASVEAVRAVHETYGREAAVMILQEFQSGFCAVHGPHALAEAVREASPFPLDLSIGKPLVDLAEAISRLDVSEIVEALQALAPPDPADGRVGDDGGW